MLKKTPAVFAIGNEYQIMMPSETPSLFWVEIGKKTYYDENNGVMRSMCPVHRVNIPMSVLDESKSYTVCARKIINRKAYFTETEETVKATYAFKPVPDDNIRILHISDAHNFTDEPISASKKFGNIDLLLMNGDIPNDCASLENIYTIYKHTSEITNGNIPIVFARGNHDLRGYYAESLTDYIPTYNGNTYYTFRISSIWGMVLDCGEDKDDSHGEYGFTAAFHSFRQRQTEFIKSVIKNKENEYLADGIKHRLIICHIPFTYQKEDPFNIEGEIYSEWGRLLKTEIKPSLMLSGHLHKTAVAEVGGEMEHLNQPCKLVIGSAISSQEYEACGLILHNNENYEINFYNNK